MHEVPLRTLLRLIGVPLILAIAAGCSFEPTFKKEHLKEDLIELFKAENMNVEVQALEHTVAIHLDEPGTLLPIGDQIGLGPEFERISRTTLQILHRVLLSTDADIHFYLALFSDPNTPGAYLTMVRNMDDVQKLNVSILDTEEFMSRTIFELNYLGPDGKVNIENYLRKDIELSEFLSWQLARRIQTQLSQDFATSSQIQVGRCVGEFINGEFTFTLNVVPANTSRLDDETIQGVFDTATSLVEKVLGSYNFRTFNTVRLIHHPTGRDLVLPRTSLHLFH